MTAYLTLAEFKLRTTMPPEFVDAIESRQSGWTASQLEQASRWLDSRLRKRYAAPFATPTEQVKAWVTRLVTVRCFVRRGVDPTDPQFDLVREEATKAELEIKEAADGNVGLFDLPLLDGSSSSGISRGGPLVYSEASPYVFADVQVDAGRNEDSWRRGT